MAEDQETVPPVPPPHRAPARVLAWSESAMEGDAGPCIALWRPAGVWAAIGIAQSAERELEVEAMRRDGIGLIRRQSGGGAVLLTDGVLCWEAWADHETLERLGGPGGHGIRQAYTLLSEPIAAALRQKGIAALHAGICDLSVPWKEEAAARKIAGTAQLRRKNAVLVHGSLLAAPDVALFSRYLRLPGDQPDYRRDRSHRDFCVTAAECLSLSGREAGEKLLLSLAATAMSLAAKSGWTVRTPPEVLPPEAKRLEETKYTLPGWNWKRECPPASV